MRVTPVRQVRAPRVVIYVNAMPEKLFRTGALFRVRQKCIQQNYGTAPALYVERTGKEKKKPGASRALSQLSDFVSCSECHRPRVGLLLAYLASFAIWWVRRDTFRLALFL
jgi:hypothetical protein